SIHYHLPTDNRPALLDRITTRTRGRAYFKSLDADMVVIFSEYSLARRSPQAMPAGGPDAGKAD
ncbi:MAG TPA: hypothetical protein PLF88_05440, partial [Opitutaceae bacterium]|nr:hypothetical protein [Opitutaceae bacterium]